jgi:ACR3 family arsenite transporter
MIGVILIGLARCIAMVVVGMILLMEIGICSRTDCLKQYFPSIAIVYMLMFLLRFFLPTLVIPVLMSISVLAKSRKRWYLFRIPFALGIISRYALIHLKAKTGFRINMCLLSHQLLLLLYYSQL